MAEEQPEKGTPENPLTREDVLKAIEENGGDARRLDLSQKWFEPGINLQNLPLEGINLQNGHFHAHIEGNQPTGVKFDGSSMLGANLRNAWLEYASFGIYSSKPTALQGADLRGAHLDNADFHGADLTAAQFQETEIATTTKSWGGQKLLESLPAYLDNTDLRHTLLTLAQFKGCYFYGTKLEGARIRGADIFEAHLEEANWGSYQIGEEQNKEFYFAESVYRRLKLWYTNAGMYDIAAEFYYREMESKRKSWKWSWNINVRHRFALEFVRLLFGYGERWKRILYWIAGVIVGSGLLFFLCNGIAPYGRTLQSLSSSLYYSTVSFTALGYGPWFEPDSIQGWAKAIGAAESFLGVLMMAALLVTFVRKWTR